MEEVFGIVPGLVADDGVLWEAFQVGPNKTASSLNNIKKREKEINKTNKRGRECSEPPVATWWGKKVAGGKIEKENAATPKQRRKKSGKERKLL